MIFFAAKRPSRFLVCQLTEENLASSTALSNNDSSQLISRFNYLIKGESRLCNLLCQIDNAKDAFT